MNADDELAALFRLHHGLPRHAPGSDTATAEAIRRLPAGLQARGPTLRVLDLGCGCGRHSLMLARTLGAEVFAVDLHRPFLDQLAGAADDAGLDFRITTLEASFDDLEALPKPVDLIWAEGSIYNLGLTEGLALWRKLLDGDGGALVLSDAVWTTDAPDPEAVDFWAAAYPGMATVDGAIAHAEAAGFRVQNHFLVDDADWWSEYYDPLQKRIDALASKAENEPALAAVLDAARREIDLRKRHADAYGYLFMVLTPVEAEADPTRLCRLDDIPDGGSNGFVRETVDGLRGYMVIRQGDAVFVYVNSCPHVGLPLDLKPGRFLNADGDRILCTTHGALFRIEDGFCVSGPCVGDALEAVPATIRDGAVHIPA